MAAATPATDASASPIASPALIPAAPAPVPSAASPTEALAAPSPTPAGQSPRIYGPATGPSRILLHANADSWVQVRETDHTVLFTGLLKPGDSYRVPDLPGLSMRAGNAGGLDIVVDGRPAPSLGPAGAVRNVMLDPQALMAGAARHD
jgi:cytoskeleton protein RodZ